jgi:hypothetical protein
VALTLQIFGSVCLRLQTRSQEKLLERTINVLRVKDKPQKGQREKLRDVVIIGHSPIPVLKVFLTLGVAFDFTRLPMLSQCWMHISLLANYSEQNQTSLNPIRLRTTDALNKLGVRHTEDELWNAGNDAAFALMAALERVFSGRR